MKLTYTSLLALVALAVTACFDAVLYGDVRMGRIPYTPDLMRPHGVT